MANRNRDTQERINALVTEEQLQNNIADALTSRLQAGSRALEEAEKLRDTLISQTGVENKLEEILKTKQKLLQGELNLSGQQAQLLLTELEYAEELLKTEKKRADKTAEIKQLLEDTTESLLYSVGLSKEMFKNGVAFGLGMLAAKKGAEMLTSAFESTVGQAKEMYKTFGASVKESARVGMEVGKATFSMTGLIYGSESVAESANDIATYFNSTASITSDTVKNVTELSALMGDGAGAVRMNTILNGVNDNAADITDSIKDIANKSGVTASAVFKEMDAQAGKLLGKSEKELKIIAKQTAAMIKLGVTKEHLANVTEGVLDIESSIAAQNKARLFGVDVDMQKIREVAMAYEYGGASAEEFAKVIAEQVGSSEKFGKMAPGIQKMYAAQLHMTTDEITDMLLKQEELRKNVEKYGEEGAETVAKLKEGFGGAKTFIAGAIPLLAQSSTFLKNMGVDTSKVGEFFKKLNPFKGASAPAPPTPPPTPPGPPGPPNPMGGINATSLIKGAAAMLIMAAALYVLGKAIELFTGDKVLGGMLNAVIALAVFTAAMFGLGALISGPGAAIFGAGVVGFLLLGAALIVLGAGLQSIAKSLEIFSQFSDIFTPLVGKTGGLALFGLALIPLGLGVAAFALGLGVLAPVVPVLEALVALGAGVALIANALGYGGDSSESSETTSSDTKKKDPLITAIENLGKDIREQPINVVLDNSIVGKINRGSRAINSYTNKN